MMDDLQAILNENQLEGVTQTEGPVLILAGAGSGKTRVLTHRVAYLIENKHVEPYHILAITFTNKAAGEMKERIHKLAGDSGEMVWVATFHATCVRILRRFADRIGYDNRFTIYDTDDSKTVMKEVIRKLKLDPKRYKERYFLNKISSAKNELIPPEGYAAAAGSSPDVLLVARAYAEYQARLRSNNAMDFDDLLMKTVELFRLDAEVLNIYQSRFRYIMVDEYQDTNTAQFAFIELLARAHGNLCVVGDDDQSIYKFRGANIRNILDFEQHFPDAKVIKLEQNYRSVQTVLDVANSVIQNNRGRKEKKLWTDNGAGERVIYRQFDSGAEEALFIASDIAKQQRSGNFNYRDCAVLYRTNAQSRLLEEQFLVSNIPYRIVGGVNFYGRREIKDVLAYLKTIDNARDDLACRRIINVPKRGIGATTISRVADYADDVGIGFYQALQTLEEIPNIGRAKSKLNDFVLFIEGLKAEAEYLSVSELIKKVLELTGYVAELELEGTDEAKTRIENIDELVSKAVSFEKDYVGEEDDGRTMLSAFLEEVALIADIDRLEGDDDYVVLMTLHSAKGLEFDNVYLAGMEDGLFPSFLSITADNPDEEIEEERRLCYVGITRAKKRLVMTAAKMRMIRGETRYSATSRFVREIPKELLNGEVYEPRSYDNFTVEEEDDTVEEEKSVERKAHFRRTVPAPKKSPTTAATYQKKMSRDFGTKIEKNELDYVVGDRVSHQKFGEGEVLSINDGGRDFEVTVRFEGGNVRKMFASFAKLTKV